jgi:putative hydrolase of the HAD superfamily
LRQIVVATKGDLLDQRRKLHNGPIHHHMVMSDKQEVDYSDLIRRLEINPIFHDWNSKSDVLPVLAIGHAVHILHTTGLTKD